MSDRGGPEGVVYDLGYQPYAGERLGRRGATLAVYRDGLRRVLGLRRKARRKVMPFGLIALVLSPAIFFLAFTVLTGELITDDFNRPIELFDEADFFTSGITVTATLLFIALAGSELLLPDRISGTLEVYASRPVRIIDYLGARAGALASLVVGFLFFPQLLLVFGNAFVSTDGFLTSVGNDIDIVWKAALASGVYLLAYAPLAFLLASIASRLSFATGIYIAIMLVLDGIANALVEEQGLNILGLVSLNHHGRYVADWIYDANSHFWIPDKAGFEPWVSLAVIVGFAAVSMAIVVRRYRTIL